MQSKSFSAFVHYSRKDARLVHRALEHLKAVERQTSVTVWTVDDIPAGEHRQKAIKLAIQQSTIAIVFVSPSMLQEFASDEFVENLLFERSKNNNWAILPILIKPCFWDMIDSLSSRQILPRSGKALSLYKASERDAVLRDICFELINMLKIIVAASTSPAYSSQPQQVNKNTSNPYLWTSYNHQINVAREREENTIKSYINYCGPGQPVVVCAPHLFGKTWLLKHILYTATNYDDKIVFINLDLIHKNLRVTLDGFLVELATLIAEDVLEDAELVQKLWRSTNPINSFKRIIEKILGEISASRLLLTVDRVDSIVEFDYRDSFFSMLRSMCDAASKQCWNKFRLLLLLTHKPNMLIQDPHRSPFNLTPTIFLEDFTEVQSAKLLKMYHVETTPAALHHLREYIGGHPYMTHLAAYAAARNSLSLENLVHDRKLLANEYKPFLENLKRRIEMDTYGQRNIEKLERSSRVSTVPIDPKEAQQLVRDGILIEEGTPGSYRVRYRLFETFLNSPIGKM